MRMNSSQSSHGSGNTIKAPQAFLVLVALVALGAGINFAVKAIQEAREAREEDKVTQELCRTWTNKVLAEAKENPPEAGNYEAELPVNDSWEQPLTSILVVKELSNFVRVHSTGRDGIRGSDDDHVYSKEDVHVRKSILKGLMGRFRKMESQNGND